MTKVTQEQIKGWKEQYKDIFELKVADKKCFVRKPTRQELSYAAQKSMSNPLGFNEYILNACWLGGDVEIKENDELFLGASGKIAEIIKVADAEIKKL